MSFVGSHCWLTPCTVAPGSLRLWIRNVFCRCEYIRRFVSYIEGRVCLIWQCSSSFTGHSIVTLKHRSVVRYILDLVPWPCGSTSWVTIWLYSLILVAPSRRLQRLSYNFTRIEGLIMHKNIRDVWINRWIALMPRARWLITMYKSWDKHFCLIYAFGFPLLNVVLNNI